jgi:hypothetical protein
MLVKEPFLLKLVLRCEVVGGSLGGKREPDVLEQVLFDRPCGGVVALSLALSPETTPSK